MPQLSGEPGRRTSGRAPRVGRTGWYCVYISWCTPDCRGGQDKAARYPHEIPGVRLADKKDPLLYMARKSWLAQITLATCTTCCRWPSSPSSGHKQNVNPPASTGLQTLYASLLPYHGDKTGVKRQIPTHGWVGACTGTRGRGTKALETQDKLLRSYSATLHCSSRHRIGEVASGRGSDTAHTRDTGTPSVLSGLV